MLGAQACASFGELQSSRQSEPRYTTPQRTSSASTLVSELCTILRQFHPMKPTVSLHDLARALLEQLAPLHALHSQAQQKCCPSIMSMQLKANCSVNMVLCAHGRPMMQHLTLQTTK